MHFSWPFWVGFHIFVFGVLIFDLGIMNRKPREIRFKEAMAWSAIWISLSLLFNVWLYFWFGKKMALEFLSGYLIEKSLSVDNIFVFLTLFSFFRIPLQYQHKVLFWGVLGALLMRAALIFAGIELIEHFHGVIYIFGSFLVLVGIKMAFYKEESPNFENNSVVKLVRKIFPISDQLHGGRFIYRKGKKKSVTRLFLVLVLIELADLVFAIDSIPAVLSVTTTPFIVYTSNIFAILGLRSLYFALAEFMRVFFYLHYGIAAILIFIGSKMMLSDFYTLPIGVVLLVIFLILLISILASVAWNQSD